MGQLVGGSSAMDGMDPWDDEDASQDAELGLGAGSDSEFGSDESDSGGAPPGRRYY